MGGFERGFGILRYISMILSRELLLAEERKTTNASKRRMYQDRYGVLDLFKVIMRYLSNKY